MNPSRPRQGEFSHGRMVTILLVDDQPANLLALEAVLDDPDYTLVKAHSGEEALLCLLRGDFALILMDVMMPGMDGYETAEMIRQRERTRYTPIIFVTAIDGSDAHVARGYSAGAVDYLFKPLITEVLRSKVSAFVELFRKTEEVKRQADQLRQFAKRVSTKPTAGRRAAATGGRAKAARHAGSAGDSAEALPGLAANMPGL